MNVSKKKVTSSLPVNVATEVVIDSQGIIRYPSNGLVFEYSKLSKLLLSTISLTLEEKMDILRSLHKLTETQRKKLEKVLDTELEKLENIDRKNPGYLKDIRNENVSALSSVEGFTIRIKDFAK